MLDDKFFGMITIKYGNACFENKTRDKLLKKSVENEKNINEMPGPVILLENCSKVFACKKNYLQQKLIFTVFNFERETIL